MPWEGLLKDFEQMLQDFVDERAKTAVPGQMLLAEQHQSEPAEMPEYFLLLLEQVNCQSFQIENSEDSSHQNSVQKLC